MTTKIRDKTCKTCGKKFTPTVSINPCCSPNCFYKYQDKKIKEKKAKVREAKKTSLTTLDNIAMKLWGRIIRGRALKCEYCGNHQTDLDAHHIFGRRSRATRLELSNGIALCKAHHTFSAAFSAHQTPYTFDKWLDEYKGEKYMQKLTELSRIPHKVTREGLQEIITVFKFIIEENGY